MFYEVRLTFPKTKQRKIISSKELSRRHWAKFKESQKGFNADNNTKSSSI